ncbi:MAG: poly-gamma-glutamate system protein [Acholeplasmataceae bacterium]|jgi:poly-gamma-glutamate system protein
MNTKHIILGLWAVLSILAVAITNTSTSLGPSKHYEEKKEATILTKKAFAEIKEYKMSLGFPNVDEDIHNSGLIGERYTPITTTLGILESKRTSTNPNFAAVIIDMFEEAKIKKGDEVVVTFSGSFPALNIAVMAAIEVFELKPLIMASIGSSSYGANNPEFTYVHMSNHLYETAIFSHKIDYVSLGGANDTGNEFESTIRENLLTYVNSSNIDIIEIEDFKKNIDYRFDLIKQHVPNYKMLINVGGNLISLGREESSFYQKNGLIIPSISNVFVNNDNKGLIQKTLEKRIPVIQLLNLKSLAYKYSIPYDSVDNLEIGKGDVYFEKKVNLMIPIITVVLTGIIIVFYSYYYKRGQ